MGKHQSFKNNDPKQQNDSSNATREALAMTEPTNETHARPSGRQDYWRANLKLVAGCLLVWFLVSYGFGIILVDLFNQFSLGGYPLGFWFATQGSIYVFVVLIFFYAWRMNKLDRRFGVAED